MYNCELIRVVDGDTVILNIDLGLQLPLPDGELAMGLAVRQSSLWVIKERVRLVRVNAPEMKTPEGPISKDYLASLCADCPLKVVTYKRERYGRVLADIFNCRGESLSQLMLASKRAAPY